MHNSTSDPRADTGTQPHNQPPDLSESDFLAAEAAAARRKFTDSIERLRDDLKDCADVPAWARKYPWPTLGVAAALGFLLGTAIIPKRPKDNTAQLLAAALAAKDAGASVPPQPSMFAGLVGELMRSLFGALEGAIVGAFSSRMAAANQTDAANPPDADGQPEPADPSADPPGDVPDGNRS